MIKLSVFTAGTWIPTVSITADKIPEAFEKQDINKAVTPLNFDKAKGAAMAPDTDQQQNMSKYLPCWQSYQN